MARDLSLVAVSNIELLNRLLIYRLAYEENQNELVWEKIEKLMAEILLRMNAGITHLFEAKNERK